jgi:hypothetical protein
VIRQLPANDTPGMNVEDGGKITPSLPSEDAGEVGNPQLIGVFRCEVAPHEIGRGGNGLLFLVQYAQVDTSSLRQTS